jgi:predicted nucleic acid-binding protein
MSLVEPISYWKAHYLDASAAVKLVIEEAGSSNIKRYFFGDRAGFFITSLSLAEALGVFKRKLFYDETTKKNYFDACYSRWCAANPKESTSTRSTSQTWKCSSKQRTYPTNTTSIYRIRFRS